MEKILATREAYDFIKDHGDSPEMKLVYEAAAEMAQRKHGEVPEYFIIGASLAVAALWSKFPGQASSILIYKHVGYPKFLGTTEMNAARFIEMKEDAVAISE